MIQHESAYDYTTQDPLWPGVVIPVRVSSLGQIELFNPLLYLKLFNSVQTYD